MACAAAYLAAASEIRSRIVLSVTSLITSTRHSGPARARQLIPWAFGSASMIATLPPKRAKASARQITKVVFPTPPFVEQTLTTATIASAEMSDPAASCGGLDRRAS